MQRVKLQKKYLLIGVHFNLNTYTTDQTGIVELKATSWVTTNYTQMT